MKKSTYKGLTGLVFVALSAAVPVNTFAQDAAKLADARTQAAIAEAQNQAATIQVETTQLQQKEITIDTGSRKKFSSSATRGWLWVQTQCTSNPITDQCAALAIEMASNQCAASAKFLKKDTKSWQYLSFGLLMASAAFTGVGAAATIAGSTTVPKVFSTLGGATGLGTAVASINTNASGDQAALVSINTTLNQFISYTTTGTAKGAAAAPAIAPNLHASGVANGAFSYQIVATNSPTSFLVTGLPAGLSASASTGLISGTPTAAGIATVTLAATNASGTSSSSTLTVNIANAAPAAVPAIDSANAASGTVGSQFGYQTSATNSPTSYAVGTSLPAGLSLNAATGFISGTPATAGTIPVTLTATNAVGTSNSFTLTFTIVAAPPAGNGPAPNELVYKVASLYGTECAAAALNSSSK